MTGDVPEQVSQFERGFVADSQLADDCLGAFPPKAGDQDKPELSSGPERGPLHVIDIHAFLQLNIPPREMILGPWLPCQGLAMIYGRRGTGKTHLALGIAYAVASGGSILGWQAPKARKVLYIDGEMLAAPLQERFAALVRGSDREPEPDALNIITPDLQQVFMPDLATVGGQAALNEVIPSETQLIIVDSLSSLVRGQGRENDAESWLPIQDWALAQRVAGRSVLFLHHANRRGEQRGTSKREDVLDTVLALRPPAEYQPNGGAHFEVHIEKSRALCAEFVPVEAELVGTEDGGVMWSSRPIAETLTQRILKLAGDGMSKSEIAEELKVNRSTVYRALKRGGPGKGGSVADVAP